MNIRIFSDLHLEFGPLALPALRGEHQDVLVLAGDVGVASKPNTFLPFLEEVSTRFRDIIYIMGNHEHYHGSIVRSLDKVKEATSALTNLHVIENEVVRIDDVSFVCSTLWSSYDNGNPMTFEQARRGMNDHRTVRTGPPHAPYQQKFRPEDAYYIFADSVNFIFPKIMEEKRKGQKVCVVTHHAPSRQSVAPQFRAHKLNGAYASDLDDRILEASPHVWIHGHTHASFTYRIGQTAVICNPRGYAGYEENPDFNPNLRITL